MLASAVCLSPLDFSPSKTYKRALKFEVFLCFPKKNYEKRKNVMKFLTGRDDVISKIKLHSHVREKILGKVTKGILKIGYGSGVTQQKVGLGVNLPPPLVLYVLIKKYLLTYLLIISSSVRVCLHIS